MKSRFRIVEILIALGTLVVGVASFRVAKNQELIISAQLVAQKKEHVPSFQIEKYLTDNDSTECFKLSVVKNSPKSILSIRTQTYYKIDEIITTIQKYEILKTYYVPVDGYYSSHGEPYNLTGTVVCDSTSGNMSDYLFFKRECKNWSMSESNRSYSCDKIDFIIIEYLDIYGEEHREYFEGTSLSTPDVYENIQKLSKEAFKENYYRRETIMLKDVLEDLDE